MIYLQMTDTKSSESSAKFKCECCDYITVRKSQYERHLMTLKHKILTNTYEIVPKSSKYNCECGKEYKHRQSLYTHKQKCSYTKNVIAVIDNDTPGESTLECMEAFISVYSSR